MTKKIFLRIPLASSFLALLLTYKSLAQLWPSSFKLQQVRLILGNLTLTRIDLKNAENPRVQKQMAIHSERKMFDWTHMYHPIFPKGGIVRVRTHYLKSSKRKQEPSTRIIFEKRELFTITFDSEKLWKKEGIEG